MSYDRQLERWTVHHRAGWLNPVFEGLSWIGGKGLVRLAIALVLAVWWRRPWLFAQVALADFRRSDCLVARLRRVHYPLDVLGGAVLGCLIAIALRWLSGALRRSRRARPAG